MVVEMVPLKGGRSIYSGVWKVTVGMGGNLSVDLGNSQGCLFFQGALNCQWLGCWFPQKGGCRWHSPSPKWQEKCHLYTTYSPCRTWGVKNATDPTF